MISDEAVEAALEVFWANEDETYLTAMRMALEAAAPHLLAQAEARGQAAGETVILTLPAFHEVIREARAEGFAIASPDANNPFGEAPNR